MEMMKKKWDVYQKKKKGRRGKERERGRSENENEDNGKKKILRRKKSLERG